VAMCPSNRHGRATSETAAAGISAEVRERHIATAKGGSVPPLNVSKAEAAVAVVFELNDRTNKG
jgi:hypothetical protein